MDKMTANGEVLQWVLAQDTMSAIQSKDFNDSLLELKAQPPCSPIYAARCQPLLAPHHLHTLAHHSTNCCQLVLRLSSQSLRGLQWRADLMVSLQALLKVSMGKQDDAFSLRRPASFPKNCLKRNACYYLVTNAQWCIESAVDSHATQQ